MAWELKMPRFDEGMFEGTVTRWLKKEGDSVQKGEPVIEIETQKVAFEVEAPGSGILRIILAQEGELLPVNSVMGVIADPAEDINSYQKPLQKRNETLPVPEEAPAATSQAQVDSFPEMGRIAISPVSKKPVWEEELDITKIRGTGPGGVSRKKIY